MNRYSKLYYIIIIIIIIRIENLIISWKILWYKSKFNSVGVDGGGSGKAVCVDSMLVKHTIKIVQSLSEFKQHNCRSRFISESLFDCTGLHGDVV